MEGGGGTSTPLFVLSSSLKGLYHEARHLWTSLIHAFCLLFCYCFPIYGPIKRGEAIRIEASALPPRERDGDGDREKRKQGSGESFRQLLFLIFEPDLCLSSILPSILCLLLAPHLLSILGGRNPTTPPPPTLAGGILPSPPPPQPLPSLSP